MNVAESRLQTVIRVKDFQVKKAQKELAQIKVQREEEQGTLDTLEETQSTAMSDAAREMKAKAVDVQTSRAFIQSLSRQIKQQEGKVEEIQGQEDDKRGELLEKTQSQQMLEKLDQKRKDEVEKEQEKKSQRMLDVLAQRMKSGF